MVRKLSDQLQEKAISELNENPKTREKDLKHLRKWLHQHPKLKARVVDDQWLLSFLRGSKFNLTRTKEKIVNFYKAKDLHPRFMKYEDPKSEKYMKILDANIILPLPRSEDSIEPQCILIDYDKFNSRTMDYDDMVAAFFMILSILITEDDNCVISGVKILLNGENFPYRILYKFTPNYIRSALFCFLKAYPLRLKGLCFVNMNAVLEIIYRILQTVMPLKLKKRMLVISKNNYEDVYNYIPQKHLPKEYRGENSSIEELGKYWKAKVEMYADRLKDDGISYYQK